MGPGLRSFIFLQWIVRCSAGFAEKVISVELLTASSPIEADTRARHAFTDQTMLPLARRIHLLARSGPARVRLPPPSVTAVAAASLPSFSSAFALLRFPLERCGWT